MRFLNLYFLTCTLVLSGILHAQSEAGFFDLIRKGDLDKFRTHLLASPEAASIVDENGYTPLILAAYHGQLEMVQLLAPLAEDINYNSGYGTALMGAAVKGETAIAKVLLAHGADPNATDADTTTPIIFASMFQNDDLALMLLEAGGDPNHKNNKGFSALDYARMHKNTTLIIKFENN